MKVPGDPTYGPESYDERANAIMKRYPPPRNDSPSDFLHNIGMQNPALLMAGAMMQKEGKLRLAGDVVPLGPKIEGKVDQESMNDILRRSTRETLQRALGTSNILPMRPK